MRGNAANGSEACAVTGTIKLTCGGLSSHRCDAGTTQWRLLIASKVTVLST